MTPIRQARLESPRDSATPRVALVARVGAFLVLAFLCASAVAQAVNQKLHVPLEHLERLAGGEPLDIIVQFDDDAVRAEAARKRALRGIPHDDDGIRDEKARRYAEIKRRVLERHQRNGFELRKDYRHLPMSQLRVASRALLDELLTSPEVVAVYPEGEEQAFLAESAPLVREPQAFAAGYSGAGTTVAVLDTGVDYTRAAFGSCTSPGVPAGCKVPSFANVKRALISENRPIRAVPASLISLHDTTEAPLRAPPQVLSVAVGSPPGKLCESRYAWNRSAIGKPVPE